METSRKKNPINKWSEDDRPREKLFLKGKTALSNAELIAIIIGSGSREKSALQLAQEILNNVQNNLIELSKMSVQELMRFKGMGYAKAIGVVAALELGKRRLSENVLQKKIITKSKDVYDVLFSELTDSYSEKFYVLLLDSKNTIIKKLEISVGGLSSTQVDVKKVFKEALAYNAASIILTHNHPSNNTMPSNSDIALTKQIIKAGKVLNIKILDHVIFGNDNYYSFKDNGLMDE